MLKHLHISNFAIVPSLELDFEPGFTAVTGETGAGKSILVGALGLLLGERSDANWVRPGEERAELTAEFDISANTGAQAWLAAAELETDDMCLLRRTISNSGRSRAFINGSPVTVAQLQALGDRLVEIHGQNEHLQLTNPSAVFRLLDGSGSYARELTAVADAHDGWRQAQDALAALEQDSAVPAAELEFLQFQLDELQQFELDAGAIAELQTEHDRLAAGDALLEAVRDSMQRLDPEPGSDMDGINSGLNRALDDLRAFEHLDRDIAASCQMLQEASVNTIEAVNALRAAMERIDTDPARFEAVDDELGRLNALARKHGVAMEALAGVRDTLAARVEAAGHSAERRDELRDRAAALLERYREAARTLHAKRGAHAAELAQRVTRLMADLGMAGGCFEINVTHDPEQAPGRRGDDRVQVMVSANPGLPPGPLAKIASGGELSRISLAIKAAASRSPEALTQVFDEVDAGIGGDTANTVGRLLRRLAGAGQALCVTHLAQVAVCATHQLQVSKAAEEDSTRVETRLLGAGERIDEIARMLSGRLSEQSRAHARELLQAAEPA